VNNNLLAPGTFVDELSGNAAVNGIPWRSSPPDSVDPVAGGAHSSMELDAASRTRPSGRWSRRNAARLEQGP
jgi:hypothetical protein